MEPITAMTLGSIGISAIGSLRSASQRRKQLREQARLRRMQVQEMIRRTEENIAQRQREAGFAQRQALATINASGAGLGGTTALGHMNQIANQIARETNIMRRETEFAARAGLSESAAMRKEASQGFLDTVNILGGAGIQAGQTWQMAPRQGGATPRQENRASSYLSSISGSIGSDFQTSLLDLG